MIDLPVLENLTENLRKNLIHATSKYIELPSKVEFHYGEQVQESPIRSKESNSFLPKIPRYKWEDVSLPPHTKREIQTALAFFKHHETLFDQWSLGQRIKQERAIILNFFGLPGTGKSLTAEAIASLLGKKILRVDYAQLESKYVGDTPKNIRTCFQTAQEADAVLVFDEADSLLSARLTSVQQSADYGVNLTRSVMLLELEQYAGIVIFTTNLIANYDDAFKRRILANVQFDLPNLEARKAIWNLHLTKDLPLEQGITDQWLAETFDKTSGADIKDILLFASVHTLENNRTQLLKSDFEFSYNTIMKRYLNKDISLIDVNSRIVLEED